MDIELVSNLQAQFGRLSGAVHNHFIENFQLFYRRCIHTSWSLFAGQFSDIVQERVNEAKNSLNNFSAELVGQISDLTVLIVDAYRQSRKVIFMGNGGSAADSQHLAAELVGRFYKERRALEAIALNCNSSILTGVGNDYGYEHTFRRQIEALAHEGDIVIGISTSGNSPNVVEALNEARLKKCRTVGLTGDTGGKMKALVELCLCVPSSKTPRIQENHILIGHIVCELVEETLFGNTNG